MKKSPKIIHCVFSWEHKNHPVNIWYYKLFILKYILSYFKFFYLITWCYVCLLKILTFNITNDSGRDIDNFNHRGLAPIVKKFKLKFFLIVGQYDNTSKKKPMTDDQKNFMINALEYVLDAVLILFVVCSSVVGSSFLIY